jgi:NF-kappa-B inhibitor alpha
MDEARLSPEAGGSVQDSSGDDQMARGDVNNGKTGNKMADTFFKASGRELDSVRDHDRFDSGFTSCSLSLLSTDLTGESPVLALSDLTDIVSPRVSADAVGSPTHSDNSPASMGSSQSSDEQVLEQLGSELEGKLHLYSSLLDEGISSLDLFDEGPDAGLGSPTCIEEEQGGACDVEGGACDVEDSVCDVDDSVCDEQIQEGSASDVQNIYQTDDDGDTLLHVAIIQLLADVALSFISMTPDCHHLNMANRLLQTPLHLAVITGQTGVVRRLLVAGADICARDRHGNTPIQIAAREGYQDVVSTLLEPVRENELAQNKHETSHQNIPQNLNVRNYEGHTCLHVASLHGNRAVMQILLANGSDVNTGDGKSGRTVLHYAAETNNVEIVKFLLQQDNVNVNARTYGGVSARMLADSRDYSGVVTVLTRAGAESADGYDSDTDSDDSSSSSDTER